MADVEAPVVATEKAEETAPAAESPVKKVVEEAKEAVEPAKAENGHQNGDAEPEKEATKRKSEGDAKPAEAENGKDDAEKADDAKAAADDADDAPPAKMAKVAEDVAAADKPEVPSNGDAKADE